MKHDTSAMLKLNVFESYSMTQQIFCFNTCDVLTAAELSECEENAELLKEKITLAVNSRLLIREIPLAKSKVIP